MKASLEPSVTFCQELIVTPVLSTIGYMGIQKSAWAKRFNECCTDAGIPPKGKNRQELVGKMFGVSQKGARKWLEAESLPTLEKCMEMATRFEVQFDWFMTGRPPKKLTKEQKLPPKEIITLATKIAAMPEEKVKLLMDIFATAVGDEDPRLKPWDAKNNPPDDK